MSVGLDGRIFDDLLPFFQAKCKGVTVFSSVVGGGNTTCIGCQSPVNHIEEEERVTGWNTSESSDLGLMSLGERQMEGVF